MVNTPKEPCRLPSFRPMAFIALPACLALGVVPGAAAQEPDTKMKADEQFFDGLRTCRAMTDDAARLACFDNAVGQVISANDQGDVAVIAREEAQETRRRLFGFNIPNLGIFGGDDEEEELFETTIDRARYLTRRKARLVTAEGAVWELSSIPSRQRPMKPGDKVVFKEAAMGTYFVRINGQRGVRGKRVE